MESKVYHVLFICTGNSARSQMAEVLLNTHGQGRFKGFSAGSRPAGQVHPLAIETLQKAGYSTGGLRSKSWNEFGEGTATAIDLVFTLCDSAAGEECPVWAGRPVRAHWGIPDPGHKENNEERLKAFHEALLVLKRRIDLLTVLPIDKLDSLTLKHRVTEIGEQP